MALGAGGLPRNLVRKMVERLAGHGYTVTVSAEIEATVFEESIHEPVRGYRGLMPIGGAAGTAYHLAEDAAAQIELNIAPGNPIMIGGAWARTRRIMREVAFELGHTVTFMAKPTGGYGQASPH